MTDGAYLLTAADVARRLRLTPRTVREMARCGKLPYLRLNRRDIRFSWDHVVARLARYDTTQNNEH